MKILFINLPRRENEETIFETAKRELQEETGVLEFQITKDDIRKGMKIICINIFCSI